MKKNNYIALLILLGIGLIFLGVFLYNKDLKVAFNDVDISNKESNIKEDSNEDNSLDKENNNIIEIKLSDLITKLDNKESFILLFTGTTCPVCLNYKPVLNALLEEYDLKVFNVDLWAFDAEERTKFNELFLDVEYVPLTTIVVNGQEQKEQRMIGNIPKDNVITFLKNNGYI